MRTQVLNPAAHVPEQLAQLPHCIESRCPEIITVNMKLKFAVQVKRRLTLTSRATSSEAHEQSLSQNGPILQSWTARSHPQYSFPANLYGRKRHPIIRVFTDIAGQQPDDPDTTCEIMLWLLHQKLGAKSRVPKSCAHAMNRSLAPSTQRLAVVRRLRSEGKSHPCSFTTGLQHTCKMNRTPRSLL